MVKHVRERARSQPAQGQKAKVKEHNEDQAGSPNEDGHRTLGDFGRKNLKELNLSVMSKRMMILRVPFGSSSLCVLCSKVQQHFNGFDGIAEFVEKSL